MNGLILATILLSQAPGQAAQDAIENIKGLSFAWRICTADAVRHRALDTAEPSETVVDAALEDCDREYQSLRNAVLVGTRGKYPDPNNPDPWLKIERDSWQARLINGVPNIRNGQKRCSANPDMPICKRLLAQ